MIMYSHLGLKETALLDKTSHKTSRLVLPNLWAVCKGLFKDREALTTLP